LSIADDTRAHLLEQVAAIGFLKSSFAKHMAAKKHGNPCGG
jgi:hypothetical protein